LSDKPREYDWAGLPLEVQRLEAQAKSMEMVVLKELELMRLKPNMKVLDAGCGTGAITRKIAQIISPGEAYGLDIDPFFIENAKKIAELANVKNIRFDTGNIDDLSFEDGLFDKTYCRFVLMHVNDPAHTVKELSRVTKKAGTVHVSDTDDGALVVYPPVPKFQELWMKFGQRSKENGMNRYIGRELYSIFSKAGLKSIQILPIPIYSTQDNPTVLKHLASIHMDILAQSKENMVEEGWLTEHEFIKMVDEVENALRHPGAFVMGLSFLATGVT
jgi:ubiquinone/menaquinone biosynthesis C-methylase UbiE